MMTCTHHWTVTSECPRCLREELNQVIAERDKMRTLLAQAEQTMSKAAQVITESIDAAKQKVTRDRVVGFVLGTAWGLLLATCSGCASMTPTQKKIAAAATVIVAGSIAASQHGDARTRTGLPNVPDCARYPESCR